MDVPSKNGWVKSSSNECIPSTDVPGVKVLSCQQLTPVSASCSQWQDPSPLNLTQSFSKEVPPESPEVVPVNKFNRKCSQPDDPYNVEYSMAINQLGVGRFHWGLALTCGFMFLSAGLENNLNAYILPSVHCDLQISAAQMGLLNAVFLAGGISSNFLWGMIADIFGRKTVLVYGMSINGFLTLISSLSQHFQMLLVFRFLSGFIVGGPSSLVFAYMGEFFPDGVRATVICYVGIFWTLSWVIMPAMAWLIIPIHWSVTWGGFVFNSWRLLIAFTAAPSLISTALLTCFPESPRFVLVQGQGLKAVGILARIYSINNKKDPALYSVKSLNEHIRSTPTESDPKLKPVTVLVRQAQQLFAGPNIKITALSSFLFFSNMFGYYGLGLWLPELFHRMSSHLERMPNAQVTLCTVGVDVSFNTSMVESAVCDPTDIDSAVFTKSLVMGVVGLLGNVISGVLSGRLQRRTLPVILMGLSALCIIVIYMTTNMTLNLVMASAFQLTVGTANLVYNSLVVDMFPPNISGMGVCMSILAGRLGGMISNLVFGNMIDVSCSTPIFLVAAVLFAGCIMSFLIPNEPYREKSQSATFKKIKQDVFIIT